MFIQAAKVSVLIVHIKRRKMKIVLHGIIIMFIIFLMLFLSGAFINWSFNPATWSPFGRFILLFIGGTITGAYMLEHWGK